jgi:phosphoglycolate phosphatase-like HAD superfamily hydrolase
VRSLIAAHRAMLARAATVRLGMIDAHCQDSHSLFTPLEWKQKQPFKGILEGDMKAVVSAGEKRLMEMMAVTHVGNTTEEFEKIVTEWISSARHPKFNRPYTDLVYQPMLELLAYLRANGFKTFIVSGGGVEFMRPWTERVYGVPPEQVVGSRATSRTGRSSIPFRNRVVRTCKSSQAEADWMFRSARPC